MLLLALSAAGLLVGPKPDMKRFRPDDFPTEMLRANKSVSAEIEVIINPAGEIDSCRLISFVGDERFANRVCSILDKRMWKPSRDAQGNAVYGRIRTSIKFTIPGTKVGDEAQRAKLRPDLELPFPEGWRGTEEISVPLAVIVGTDGHLEACKFQAEPLTKIKARELADPACEALSQKIYGALSTPQGPIQRYVSMQEVRFSRAQP